MLLPLGNHTDICPDVQDRNRISSVLPSSSPLGMTAVDSNRYCFHNIYANHGCAIVSAHLYTNQYMLGGLKY